MCKDEGELDTGRPGDRTPVSDRPDEELRAVRAALNGDHLASEEARFAVRLVDGRITLFETGDLATVSDGGATVDLGTSELWRAELETVAAEIARRGLDRAR